MAALRAVTSGDDPRQGRIAYFAMLCDGEHPHELRTPPPAGGQGWSKHFASTPAELDLVAHNLATRGLEVFAGVLPRQGRGFLQQRDYAPSQALWADCDSDRAINSLALFEPEPTCIVLSGGVTASGLAKRHAYWRLQEPLAVEDVKRHALRLAHHLDADQAACDAGRILRVPGARSAKTGRIATVVTFTGEAVSLAALTGELEDAPAWTAAQATRPKSTDELVELFSATYRETGEESRHEAFRAVVGVLLRRCDGLPPDVLLELAVGWAKTHTVPCRPDKELERQFDNLLARERKRRGIA